MRVSLGGLVCGVLMGVVTIYTLDLDNYVVKVKDAIFKDVHTEVFQKIEDVVSEEVVVSEENSEENSEEVVVISEENPVEDVVSEEVVVSEKNSEEVVVSEGVKNIIKDMHGEIEKKNSENSKNSILSRIKNLIILKPEEKENIERKVTEEINKMFNKEVVEIDEKLNKYFENIKVLEDTREIFEWCINENSNCQEIKNNTLKVFSSILK